MRSLTLIPNSVLLNVQLIVHRAYHVLKPYLKQKIQIRRLQGVQ